LFDACSGLLRPSAGRVRLHGAEVTWLSAAARSRRGLGRTFQRAQIWPSLSVAENVMLGREARLAGINPIRHLVRFPGDAADAEATARWGLELCGLLDIAEVPASVLTTSERRLVELARCLASGADVLLLDEPSAGLDAGESARLAGVLRDAVATRGVGVLLVEHDMGLVMSLCDHLYVLDVGRLLAEGGPDEIRAHPGVQAAYLGTEASPTESGEPVTTL
jgi:ABC-type branched-subunit amino acid transport system ATPase component